MRLGLCRPLHRAEWYGLSIRLGRGVCNWNATQRTASTWVVCSPGSRRHVYCTALEPRLCASLKVGRDTSERLSWIRVILSRTHGSEKV